RDRIVREALREQAEHLPFARRQQRPLARQRGRGRAECGERIARGRLGGSGLVVAPEGAQRARELELRLGGLVGGTALDVERDGILDLLDGRVEPATREQRRGAQRRRADVGGEALEL